MAGFRLTLKKLAKKYGVDIEGATYTKVVQEIVNENVARASKKMGTLSNRRMKQALTDSIKDGIVTLPDYAIPSITIRKGAEDGKMITDTLRDVLTRGLRKAITDNPNDTEKAIAQMQSHVKDTFATYTTSHAKMIAVTEVRSSVDLSKAEYIRELIARNPNRLRVTKKWVHHDHLVKIPRPTHKAIDGEKVLFNQPFSIGLMYPHDPSAPASEVIGCQCGYQVEVEEMATNEIYKELKANINRLGEIRVYKASASINPATGKPYQIGETKVRPDGTKWVKTGTFSWAKAGTKDAEEAKKKTDTDGDGKAEKKEIEGQSSKDAEDILSVYGEKGLYQLTKAGMYNLLLTHGVDDPKSLKWAEKVEKVKEIVAEIQSQEDKVEIKTQGKEEFTEKDYHILHNTDLVGDVSSLENENIHTRNGDVTLKFTKDGKLSDETYDDLMQKVDPIQGGHWGSAKTDNDTALSVALVNAPDWKPIDKMQNGMLAKYDQQLSDTMYEHCLVKGIGLRKHAQEALKNPDMSREKIPNFFRGMTVDASQYEQILAGEVDTIELTGCTAVTSFEAVADQYASSAWTKSFGVGRRSVKLVIERDDYMDNSIGMFHHNTKGYAHGNRNIGFELLTGSPSFYIKSVDQGDTGVDGYIKDFTDRLLKKPIDIDESKKHLEGLNNAVKNGAYWYYKQGGFIGDDHRLNRLKQLTQYRIDLAPISQEIYKVQQEYLKKNLPEFLDKIKNNKIRHSNNDNLIQDFSTRLAKEVEKVKGYKEIKEQARGAPYGSPEVEKYSVLNDNLNVGSLYNSDDLLKGYKEAKGAKYKPMTMKMFLDKQKPLVKSYETQMKKTADELKDYKDFYNWRNSVIQNRPKFLEKWKEDVKSKYDLTQEQIDSCFMRNGEPYEYLPYDLRYNIASKDPQKASELEDLFREMRNSDPNRRIRTGQVIGKDNPWIQGVAGNDKYADVSDKYTDNRYTQLTNIEKNYNEAKKRNELIDKYDVYNTPASAINKKRNDKWESFQQTVRERKDYIVDKAFELGKISGSKEYVDRVKGKYAHDNIWGNDLQILNNLELDLKQNDTGYKKIIDKRDSLKKEYDELVDVTDIYDSYYDKISTSHKNGKPLVLHVVCGRGKKSMTAGSDDQLEEQDNDNNQ